MLLRGSGGDTFCSRKHVLSYSTRRATYITSLATRPFLPIKYFALFQFQSLHNERSVPEYNLLICVFS